MDADPKSLGNTDNAQILYKLMRDYGVSEEDIVNGFGLGQSILRLIRPLSPR